MLDGLKNAAMDSELGCIQRNFSVYKNNVLFIRTLFREGPRDGNYAYMIPFRNWGTNRDLVLQFSLKILLNIT